MYLVLSPLPWVCVTSVQVCCPRGSLLIQRAPLAYPAKVVQAPYFLTGVMPLPTRRIPTTAPQASKDEAMGAFQTLE